MFNAIDRRSALKVDFWTLRPDPFDAEMFARRLRVILFGEPAWIATAEDTLLHKLFWNGISPSDRQLGDAAGIVAVQGASLDRDHLERWARELEVEPVLRDLLQGESGRRARNERSCIFDAGSIPAALSYQAPPAAHASSVDEATE